MPKPCLGLLLGVFVLASAAPAPAAPPAAPDAQAAAVERNLLPALVVEGTAPWTLAERMRHYNVPGVSIALIQGGGIAWAKGYGVLDLTSKTPVTPKTLFEAASLSKTVTAVAVLKLADQGKLSLNVPVNTLLKSWKLPEGPYTNGVTLERILNHTAGLTVAGFSGYAPGATLPTLLETLDGKPPANNRRVRVDAEPGTAFTYSGGGFEIAQQVVQDVSGRPFAPLVQDSVFRRCGMEDSFFQQPLAPDLAARAATGHNSDGQAIPGKWHVYPELAAAGLWTTPSDLARLAIAVQQSHAGVPDALLSKAMAGRMLTGGTFGEGGFSVGNGLGVNVDQRGKGTFSQISVEQVSGLDGYRALLVASTAGGYGVVVMANGDGGGRLADEIVRAAADVYGWKPLAAGHTKRGQPSDDQLRRISGRYRFGSDDVLTITAIRGGLKVEPLLGESFELIPVEGGDFLRVDPPTRYTFDATGVISMSLSGEQTGLRVPSGESTPLQLLLAGKTDAALTAYRKLWKEDAKNPALEELRLNDVAYEIQKRSPQQALAVFQLNAEFYPDSPNTWDSLAEAYLSLGKREEALRCYRKVLDTAPKDAHLPPDIKSMLLQNAERKVKELQGG
jgi:CubicO group peptidase (beta-lactamase class C family)